MCLPDERRCGQSEIAPTRATTVTAKITGYPTDGSIPARAAYLSQLSPASGVKDGISDALRIANMALGPSSGYAQTSHAAC
jgi:hypothetical protein